MCISKVCVGELLHHDHEKNLRDLSAKKSGSAHQAKAKRGARALRAARPERSGIFAFARARGEKHQNANGKPPWSTENTKTNHFRFSRM